MPIFRVTTRQSIGMGREIPAGSYVDITVSYSTTRPDVHMISNAFEEKYGVSVGVSELSSITFDKIG